MKNNKGFTLVELIAMLAVLAILMVITVPNMTGILNQQKETAFIEDAQKLLTTAQMKLLTEKSIKNPQKGNCIVMSMDFLDRGQEIKKAADGGEYVREESFVIIKRVEQKIEYTVRLVEITLNDEVYGIDAVEQSLLEKDGSNMLGYAEIENFSIDTATPDAIRTMDPFFTMCTTIEAVYN